MPGWQVFTGARAGEVLANLDRILALFAERLADPHHKVRGFRIPPFDACDSSFLLCLNPGLLSVFNLIDLDV